MDYARRELADRLAAEYVLGTLRGPARRRFERLLDAHPTLRLAVAQWQLRLEQLSVVEPGVEPPPRVWRRIEQRLFAAPPAPPRPAWWNGLALWRGLSALTAVALAAVLVLGGRGTPEAPPQASAPPIVVVLQANAEAAGVLQAAFVAGLNADGSALVLRPLAEVPLQAGRALELWAVPAQGAPRSLGLVQPGAPTTVQGAQVLRGAAALAVSLEPAGGSPTGAPTGPIVSVGTL